MPRSRPLPAGPTSGSFFTALAAAAFPSVVVPLGVVVVCAAAPPTPTTTSPRMLTPHIHASHARLIVRSPIGELSSFALHSLSSEVCLLHRGVVPDLLRRSLCDHLPEVEDHDP